MLLRHKHPPIGQSFGNIRWVWNCFFKTLGNSSRNTATAVCKLPLDFMQRFSTAFTSAMQAEQTIPAIDYLLTQMFYLKPIEGIMPRDGKEISKNFTDECEWRFIPDISQIGLPSAVTDDNMASIGVLNRTIADNECCWLKFSLSDIKYIILQNEDDFVDLCKIINEVTNDDTVRKKLIFQVLIWENVKEDF